MLQLCVKCLRRLLLLFQLRLIDEQALLVCLNEVSATDQTCDLGLLTKLLLTQILLVFVVLLHLGRPRNFVRQTALTPLG
jgi:hypothetical protein